MEIIIILNNGMIVLISTAAEKDLCFEDRRVKIILNEGA